MTAAHDRAYKRLIMGTMVNIACEPSLYEELEGQARCFLFVVVVVVVVVVSLGRLSVFDSRLLISDHQHLYSRRVLDGKTAKHKAYVQRRDVTK